MKCWFYYGIILPFLETFMLMSEDYLQGVIIQLTNKKITYVEDRPCFILYKRSLTHANAL
jgi:hypothetical protein